MNRQNCLLLPLAVAFTWGVLPAGKAAAQCAVCPTATPVVAYQPVVVPTTPAAIGRWYPGKLFDTWAANRAAYRATAFTAATTAYQPVTSGLPVASYRPVASMSYQTYMPVTTYRPVIASPVVATTAYSPVVTAYSPVVAGTTVCCDACGTATVAGYAPAASACCATGSTLSGTTIYDSSPVTDVPQLDSSEPYGAQRPTPANGSPNNGTQSEQEKSAVTPPKEPEDNPTGTGDPMSFEAPPLFDPRLQKQPADVGDPTARADRTDVIPAVYNEPVRPNLVSRQSRNLIDGSAKKSLPSRTERDAGWKPLLD